LERKRLEGCAPETNFKGEEKVTKAWNSLSAIFFTLKKLIKWLLLIIFGLHILVYFLG
jgi:hypothetical protein